MVRTHRNNLSADNIPRKVAQLFMARNFCLYGRFECFRLTFRLSFSSHSLKTANWCVRSPLEPYFFVLARIVCQLAPLQFDACMSLPSMEKTNGLLPSQSDTSRCFSHRNNLSAESISRRVAQLLMNRCFFTGGWS